MDAEKPSEEAIFYAAIEIDSPDERTAFVKSACGEDAKLLKRVGGLLKIHYEDDRFLKSPPGGAAITLDSSPLSEGPGTIIGRYKLLQLIGEGGFGSVYMAEQEQPIRRRVALKIIKLGMDTKHVIARFEAERQALAMMDHPNIARVFDGGATDTGRPYFVMELVKGMAITDYCDQNNLDTQQRLELFVDVCKAVQHAHQKGIIHRDIKPSNVMITLHDGRPVPKIIDFGIAKATQQRLTEKTLFTEFKQFIGTPEYMSPEQAEMSGLDVDTRTDIYSLGVLLYELLIGTTPFAAKELRGAAYDELRRIIREDEPSKPSTRLITLGDTLTDIANHRHVQPDELCKIMRGDLDWIVMKSLEKDRARRYETASELALDIERHRRHEPVLAGPPSTIYRMRKFVRRNKTNVIVASSIAATLVVGLCLATIGFVQASHERDRAFAAEVVARSSEAEAVAQRQIAESQQSIAEESELMTYRHLYAAHMHLAHEAWKIGHWVRTLDLLDAYFPKAGKEDLRSFGWYHLWHLIHGDLLTIPQLGTVHAVFSPDGQTIATVETYGSTVKLWDAITGQLQATLGTTAAWSIAFSPDGMTLATGGHDSSEIKLWNVASRTEQTILIGDPSGSMCLAFSPDGRMLASSGGNWNKKKIDGAVHVWDVATGRLLATLHGHTWGVPTVAFAPDGKTLASGSWDGFVKLWDTSTWQESFSFKVSDKQGNSGVHALAFSPDGSILAVEDKLWIPTTGEMTRELEADSSSIVSLAFSPDGETLAGAILQGCVIKIWDVANGRSRNILKGHTAWVWSAAFAPDGKRLVSGSHDGTAKLWMLPDQTKERLQSHAHKWKVNYYPISRNLFDFSPDSKTIALPGEGNTVNLWDVAEQIKFASLDGHVEPVTTVAFSPDGYFVATGSLDGTVKLWNTATRSQLATFQPDDGHFAVSDLEFSPDGKVLAMAKSTTVWLIDLASSRIHASLERHSAEVSSLAFSPDGHTLATVALEQKDQYNTIVVRGTVKLWDVATGELRAHYGPWPGELDTLLSVSFSPDGKVLAVAGGSYFKPLNSGTTVLIDVATGDELGHLSNLSNHITSLSFSKDGKTLATGSFDGIIKLWDTVTWQEQMALKCEQPWIDCLKFSPNDKLLAADTVGGMVQLWCATTEEDVAERTQEITLRRLRRSIAQKRWEEVGDECSKLIANNPGGALLWSLRSSSYAKMGRWDEAIDDLSKAIELNPHKVQSWYFYGLVQLYTGHNKEYLNTCRNMLERFGETGKPDEAYWAVWTCALAPDAVEDLDRIVELAEFAVEKGGETDQNLLSTLGSIFYRAGRFEEAVGQLSTLTAEWEKTGQYPTQTSPACTWFFLAMAHQQLGNSDEAKSWFDKAVQRSQEELQSTPAWNRELTLQLFQAEAAQLLGTAQ